MSKIDSQSFDARGQRWTVRFDFNAICEIEERTGEKFMVHAAPFLALVDLDALGKQAGDDAGMVAIAQRVDFANLRQLLCWALEGEHPEIDRCTTGELIQTIGLPKAVGVVAMAIAKAIPTGEEAKPGGTANPPKARKPRAKSPTRTRATKAAKAG